VLVFKALHGQAPQCLTDNCQLVAAAGRRQLRSFDAVTCVVPRIRMHLGNRAFGVAGPGLWNALPISLRSGQLEAVASVISNTIHDETVAVVQAC